MLRILLVDDEREEREGIAFLIRKYGYPMEVAQAVNGKKALEDLQREPVDILFTDVKMPLMNGLELAKEVSMRWPQIRIIIFSAYGEFDYAKQALEANAVNYLLKPIEIEEFRRVMEELLEEIGEEKQREEERRKEDWQNRQNVFFKFLTGAPIQPGEWERAEEELFSGGSGCRLVHVEFLNNYFDRSEEQFIKLARMYLGKETEYINLFPKEAYLLVRESKYLDRKLLDGQLKKLAHDVASFGEKEMLFLAGRTVKSMREMKREVVGIQEMQQELFAWGNPVAWTEQENASEHYSREVEVVYRQLLAAVASRQKELIEQFGVRLAQIVADHGKVSRIYVQNLLYTVIRALYESCPGARQENVLNKSEALFYAKNSRELADRFRELLQTMLELTEDRQADASALIRQIRNLVEKEYMRDVSLDYVAAQVNLTPAYVSYIFKKETGKTLIKYITDIRMEKARELLMGGRQKIVQVAKACGYENQSYFNRAFKNYYGLTPKQFKEREQE